MATGVIKVLEPGSEPYYSYQDVMQMMCVGETKARSVIRSIRKENQEKKAYQFLRAGLVLKDDFHTYMGIGKSSIKWRRERVGKVS